MMDSQEQTPIEEQTVEQTVVETAAEVEQPAEAPRPVREGASGVPQWEALREALPGRCGGLPLVAAPVLLAAGHGGAETARMQRAVRHAEATCDDRDVRAGGRIGQETDAGARFLRRLGHDSPGSLAGHGQARRGT